MEFGISHYVYAEQLPSGQIELAVAKGCHLYDSGKLKEALLEFETILSKDPQNKSAKHYISKIWSRLNETGISSWELSEEMVGYINSRVRRKKIEITDQEKYISTARDTPYERFVNNTSFGYNDRHFQSSSDRSFSPDGFFIAERMRMDSVFEAEPALLPQKKMPKPKRGRDWNEFIFDATESYDPDNQNLSFHWDFGDGETSTKPIIIHSFAKEGDYIVTLTVKDDSGLSCDTDISQRILKVSEPKEGLVNEFTFDATQSYDPDKQKLSYHWDFGDGKVSDKPIVTHTYARPGEYTVTLTVKDDSGLTCDTSIAKRVVRVHEPAQDVALDARTFKRRPADMLNTWRNTFAMDVRYHDNTHEDLRIRRITNALSKPGALYLILGDTSTRLSRYTLRGVYYRGINLTLENEANEFKILWGATPHFITRTSDTQNRDAGTYIYPRKVFAVRDAYKPTESYKVGVSFMELRDSERVRTMDSNYNPKLNSVVAIDQSIEAVPDIWRIETENAYSISDEDRTDKDILIKEEKLKDLAHYIRSELAIPKFRLINSYERIGSDFRSYADLATTNVTWLSALTSDRERIDNYLEYRPFDYDPIYLDLNLSRVRNNLDNDNDIEMNQQTNYGAGIMFRPETDKWLPQAGVRLKFMDTLSVPGSQYASNDVSDRDIIFELAKKIYGVDLNTSYTARKTIDNIETWGTYTNIYSIRLAKELTDRILLSTDYSHSNSQKDRGGDKGNAGRSDYFNINSALRLWAGANLSLGYGYENSVDAAGILEDIKTNAYSLTFSWPFSKYFLRSGSQLTIAPYFTYLLADDRHNHRVDRSLWTAAVDATYQISKTHRLSASALYREDDQDNPNLEQPAGTKDYRFLMTYQKIFQ